MLLKILIDNFIALILILDCANCLILTGSLNINKDWTFLGKFCFISVKGNIVFNLTYPDDYATQNLLFYYDSQWPNVYPEVSNQNCATRETFLTPSQIFNLTSTSSDCTLKSGKISCYASRGFNLARPRWWFIALSRCYPKNANYEGLLIDYRFELTNGDNVFKRQFSADEFGIFETSIAFIILYFIISIIGFIFARILYKKILLHVTFRLFLLSIVAEFFSFLFTLIEYAQFSSSGISKPGLMTVARIFDSVAQILFLLMLILLAKGFNVTRGRLRAKTTIKLFVLFTLYIIAILVSFIYSESLFDPGLVNYFYNSPAGLAVILIKLIFGWVWFVYAVIFTIKNYPEKRKFYITLLIFFSIWFWAGPVVILSCNYLIVDHARQFVAFLIQSIIIFIGHFYFMILTRPTAANKSFPYHIKTTQIGPMDNYPHHKDNEGGNVNFHDLPNTMIGLSNIFVIQHQQKYQLDETNDNNYSEENSAN